LIAAKSNKSFDRPKTSSAASHVSAAAVKNVCLGGCDVVTSEIAMVSASMSAVFALCASPNSRYHSFHFPLRKHGIFQLHRRRRRRRKVDKSKELRESNANNRPLWALARPGLWLKMWQTHKSDKPHAEY
jgi:hypothetical protein